MQPIHDYYDRLARDYDSDRFGNSYGRYVDDQERRILREWLQETPPAGVIDLGCGTGRLLDFAMTGLDASAEMLKVAAAKFPDHALMQTDLTQVDCALEVRFDAAICFHVFMHLDVTVIERSLAAIARVVKTGGTLILDIPSQHRRALKPQRRNTSEWHGNAAATASDLARWCGPHWRIVQRRGVLFFPIHRLPPVARPWLASVDHLLGRTPLNRYSSYHVYQLERCP